MLVVVQLLHGYLGSVQASEVLTAYDQALRCFASWAQFGLPYPESEPTVELIFGALRQDMHFEVAIDTLIAIFSHPENDRCVSYFRFGFYVCLTCIFW
jgi:hypothetical protein